MHKLLAFITILLWGYNAYAQEKIDMVKILGIEKDIDNLESRIIDVMKKRLSISDTGGLQQYHVFHLGCNSSLLGEDIYRDSLFLYKLFPSYSTVKGKSIFKRRKDYICTIETLIVDSTGNVIAFATPWYAWDATKHINKGRDELAAMFFEQKIDFAFYLGEFLMKTYFAVKDNNILPCSDLLRLREMKDQMSCRTK
ncbi:MAG: hypothetical protein LBH06_06555 [Rikenellaceae bacterium]|jgi:hypothetical protein|nr:hypothetical protein [Rikenellaceae bacterium]